MSIKANAGSEKPPDDPNVSTLMEFQERRSEEMREKPGDASNVSSALGVWFAVMLWAGIAVGVGKLTGWYDVHPGWLIVVGVLFLPHVVGATLRWLFYPSPQTLLAELRDAEPIIHRRLTVNIPRRWKERHVGQYQRLIVPRPFGFGGFGISLEFSWLMFTFSFR